MKTGELNTNEATTASPWRARLAWFLRIAVGVALLAILFGFIPFTQVMSSLASAQPSFVALAFFILIFERLAAVLRNHVLNKQVGISISVAKLLEITAVSTFYGSFLPGGLAGGAVRWYKISQPEGKRAQALASVTFDRLIDTIGTAALGAAFWFLAAPEHLSPLIPLCFLGILGGLLAGLCLSLSERVSNLLLSTLARFQGSILGDLVQDKGRKVLDSVACYRQLPLRWTLAIVLLTAARHLLSTGILYAFALSLGMNVGFILLGFVRCFVNLAIMIPISFLGIGVRELSIVLLLQPYSVPGTDAMALSFLQLIVNIAITLVGGLLEIKNVLVGGRKTSPAEPS
jgi:uncharacterized protein (TIRG00374 family)